MSWDKDVTGVDAAKPGTFRSLNGAADENVFIGRASKAGFYCFFKVWRDMPYDAVLDFAGLLYRIEVKGSSNGKFNVTRGTRSGQQISKTPGTSRTRILDRDDCDYVVGVDSNNGDCYIVPEDVVRVIGIQNLSNRTLVDFKEKWKILMPSTNYLSAEQTRDGLFAMNMTALNALATSLGVIVPAGAIKVPGTRKATITGNKEKIIYSIWVHIAKLL